MDAENLISSIHNKKIKDLISLMEKSKFRRETNLFIVEGRREILKAVKSGFSVEQLYYVPEMFLQGDEVSLQELSESVPDRGIFLVTKEIYSKLAYRDSTEGVIAVIRQKKTEFRDLELGNHPLLIVLENVEKPGNIGAVLRTADACGATAVILCGCPTDLYNPNVIRSSLGTLFSVPVVQADSDETIAFLEKNHVQILTAQLQDSQPYYATDMKKGTAIVMGSEDKGLTEIWRQHSDRKIRIPMLGMADSLNVSVSTAVLCYEAVRQRVENDF